MCDGEMEKERRIARKWGWELGGLYGWIGVL